MTLPTGTISLSQVRSELGLTGPVSLGQSQVRSLAGVGSGPISMNDLRGKSSGSITVSTNYTNGQNHSGGVGNHTFDDVTASASGGSPSSYSWYWANSSSGNFSFAAGQTSQTCTPRVTAVPKGTQAYARLFCDIVVNGTTYNAISEPYYFQNTSSGGGPGGNN